MTRARASAGALLAGLCLVTSMLSVGTATAAGLLPPHNPAGNISPAPNFLSSGSCHSVVGGLSCVNPCVGGATKLGVARLAFPVYDNSARCTLYLLRSVDAARAIEGLGPLVLPTNWYGLTQPEQLFVIADIERVDRGLAPYLGLNHALSASAQRAALARTDPVVAPGFRIAHRNGAVQYGSTMASGFSAVESDYVWMYDDGWGGASTSNLACTSPTAPGCWGHRDQLLGSDGHYNPGVGLGCAICEMGAGFAVVGSSGAFTDLVERPAGSPPPMYFTWAGNVEPFLPG
ncbi:MAG: hypothetical protein ACRDV0_02420 [Acidimicrobiales bacterium]